MNTERVVDRVRKMLALAGDKGASDGERDNALRMAHATIAKYNLDMAEIEKSGKRTPQSEPREFYRATFFGRPWARIVASACAELFFCEYLYVPAAKGKDTSHLFVGRESNALTASNMAQWLVESIMREGKRYQRSVGAGNAAYRSFATGAAVRVQQRVRELLRASQEPPKPRDALVAANGAPEAPTGFADAPGTALVLRSLYETESVANRALIEQKYPTRKTGRTGKNSYDWGAASEGRKYGDTVNLNRQIGDSNGNRRH